MTSKDLRDLLEGVAAEGRDTVDLGEQQLVGRIRAKRRRSRIIVAASGLATAAVIAAAAVAVVPNLVSDEPPVASGEQGLGIAISGCGGAVSGEPRADAPLRLAAVGDLKAGPTPELATIDVEVTNAGTAPVDAVAGKSDVTVVRQGVVVAVPVPARGVGETVKLQPGQSAKYQATVSLRRCGAASTQTGERLAAGSYQLYATKVFNPADGGAATEVQGGPWTVQLK
ncbi:hypothetical protein FB561_1756 [Kribbella amoyensis]|uniref:Uncharacterized protein n=1 Tax=Kribbella amoyensis TaxID=996641 RepID=A0A561BP66_9ACTN|nr:hypothetical protein [Kribbella amoyensis]TWD80669.1 hypothetical protein FB561_1756 [Kribbella amoyensis]